ncbi:MAG: cob(I)yrinic acid a,c-diamide adenosyltransferase [Pseudomonadota bacterium]
MPTERSRLTKITTRAGDKGKTKLATGRTVSKASQVVRTMGSVDELNSHIGVLLASLETSSDQQDNIRNIQQSLFDMGAVFAMEGQFDAPDPAALESATTSLNESLPPLTEFVLPRGGQAASLAHVCRAVCRRAESEVWRLLEDSESEPTSYADAARYLNRLSDYFFVLARTLTATTEEQWHGPDG